MTPPTPTPSDWPLMPGPQTVIENPILNGPFAEPTRHFRFGEEGITDGDEVMQVYGVGTP